ncbi:MAG TPA: hypothetical protein VG167_00915 [Verrucomicrobiae bacterium]|nr:hypothetical protein [Verrucomicrobiae bacterium]
MSNLGLYAAAIQARLQEKQGQPGYVLNDVVILTEDALELETQISKALGEVGMMILIGTPELDNTTAEKTVANMKVQSDLAVGEVPTLWRGDGKPTCTEVTAEVIARLQGFRVSGFQPLAVLRGGSVPDKKRQIYSLTIGSQMIVHPTGP